MNNPAAAAAAAAAIAAGMPHMQMPPAMQGPTAANIYDHHGVHPGVGMNGVGVPKPPGQPGQPGPGELVYLGGQPHAAALGMMPQNQYINNPAAAAAAASRNAAAVSLNVFFNKSLGGLKQLE